MVLLLVCAVANAQETPDQTKDSSRVTKNDVDTIRIGNLIIIKKTVSSTEGHSTTKEIAIDKCCKPLKKPLTNVSTNWLIVDLGFTNYVDRTNYAAATAGNILVNKPGTGYPLGESDFKLNAAKSVNVNIWFFMQRLNLVKHHINLKYGLGMELNNYRFRSDISFKQPGYAPYSATNAITNAYIIRDSINFSKNKLAADYVTIPLMINFCSKPGDPKKGLSISAGVSAGYLYSQRNKQVSKERGKLKNKGDYDMEQFKFCYIAEVGLGPVRLYGSYAPSSIFQKGLNLRPYTVGIRLSNW